MQVQNLNFFDKFGRNLNLEYSSESGVFTGKIYFEPISIYLFDNENLFILEKVSDLYKFPTLAPEQALEFQWVDNLNSNEFFIYDVEEDRDLDENFISKVESKVVEYSDIDPTGSAPLDLNIPLQVNIAFNPSAEAKFERTLCIYLTDAMSPNVKTKIAEIYFYGEGEDEEERFATWATNFGIKFLREDANVLKDYDIKEALPDLEALNRIRKELLVSKEHIYPYIGTYKGLSNFVNILGYRDVLQIKEYWQNINPRSAYLNKLNMVDITDYLDDGIIDTLDLSDRNRKLKEGRQFKKTEFLALVYQFTKATNDFDDDGVPLVVETTDFTVNEVFYKLNMLGEKVKNEFLPVNVKIKDIIGEFIYFQKLTISYWRDDTHIFDYDLNDRADIAVYPGDDVRLSLRSLDPLFGKAYETGFDFSTYSLNTNGSKDPFEFRQQYNKEDNLKFTENIRQFYKEIRDQRIPNIGARLAWEFGDDNERKIGAPVILSIDIEKLSIFDLKGVQFSDLLPITGVTDPYWTFENIDYRNFYEVNWRIIKNAPNPYYFEQRGKITDLHTIAHILPYAGEYRVIIELFDFYGNVSVYSKLVTVENTQKPEIIGITRLEDKFNYQISNLANVKIEDFGASRFYCPKVNVINNEGTADSVNPYKNLLEFTSFYKNNYGLGLNLYDVEIYDTSRGEYVPYNDPTQDHPNKKNWGLGDGSNPLTLLDMEDMSIGDLYWMRFADTIYVDDFNAGFYIRTPRPGMRIQISLYPEYIVPPYSSRDELIDILNSSNHPAIKLFNYEIINGRRSDGQYIIHAQAEYLSKVMYQILQWTGGGSSPYSPSPIPFTLSSPGGVSGEGDKYTFFLPKDTFSKRAVDFLKSLSPVFDDETLFLLAKTSDLLTGAVQDPMFWQEKNYWKFTGPTQKGHLPTLIDQNAFNITDIKLFSESFTVPENAIVFFTVNNLDGKSDFVWTLTDSSTGAEIFRAKTVPFFVWKFKDIGTYSLSVKVIDNTGAEYESNISNMVTVLAKKPYMSYIETQLNRRKIEILRNRS